MCWKISRFSSSSFSLYYIVIHLKVFLSFTRRLSLCKHIMEKFYLDLEVTNGNYYLADVLEIALVAGECGYVFYSYVSVHYSVLKRAAAVNGHLQMIKSLGFPFREVMDGLVEFRHPGQAQFERILIIIAHGGYLHDFPILLTSCMKYNCDKFRILPQCMLQKTWSRRTVGRIKYKKKIAFSNRRCLYIKNCL